MNLQHLVQYLLGLLKKASVIFFNSLQEDAWCFGWQSSGMQSKDGKDMTLLGGMK